MRIIVDGDACPGKDLIEKAAKEYNLEVIIYCDMNHVIKSSYSKIVYMDSGFQSVDIAVANETIALDIVVTQDYGVAAMCLGKKAFAISPKGNVYNNENIDRLLFERHLSAKVRKGGGRTASHKKRNTDDDERLYKNLIKLIKEGLMINPQHP
jgi:uncharacterized protein YaiI (UPF0178 family)